MISVKFVFFLLLAVAGPATKANAGFLHANVVEALCALAEDKTLCTKTLDPIDTDDPKDLATAMCLATEGPMKNFNNFLSNLKAKYKDDSAYIETCEDRLSNALEDINTFREQAGKDLSTFAKNFGSLKELTTSVYVALSGCTAEVENEKLLQDLKSGMDEALKLASNAVDVFAHLEPTLKQLGINAQFN